jgi:hypothetical protein
MSDGKGDLEKKIVADLKKSGFGSELLAVEIFAEKGWRTFAGSAYLDDSEGKFREIDIQATYSYFTERFSPVDFSLEFSITADVKRSEKPWVVLRRAISTSMERLDIGFDFIMGSFLSINNLPDSLGNYKDELFRYSVGDRLGWVGHGIHESFKEPSSKSQWYSAFSSMCKATDNNLAEWQNAYVHRTGFLCQFAQPLLILDGYLYSTWINSSREIELEPINEATVRFPYRSKNFNRSDSIHVDIVTLSHLGEYLDCVPLKLEVMAAKVQDRMRNKKA